MEDESWTGAELSYICPHCGEQGTQLFIIEGVGWDMEKARSAAWQKRSPCISCKKSLPNHMNIGIDITVAPLEKLHKLGYPTPPVN